MTIKAKIYYHFFYPVIFISATVTAIVLVTYFKSTLVAYTIPFYLIIVFGFFLFRYISVLVSVSKIAKDATPSIYEKNLGFSKFRGVRIVSLTFIFDREINKSKNNRLITLSSELRYLLIFMVLSFISATVLAILTTL